MDFICQVQDRGQCQAGVNTVMNVQVPWNVGIYWLAQQLVASQEGIFCRVGNDESA